MMNSAESDLRASGVIQPNQSFDDYLRWFRRVIGRDDLNRQR